METARGYRPIDLDSSVPESIRYFIGNRVEPYLRDVRFMLGATRVHTEPALNYSIASVLCSVIGGLSRVFYNEITSDNKSFQAVARRYPLDQEPPSGIKNADEFARELYEVFRCGLVHSLGLHLERGNQSRWTITDAKERYVVARRTALPISEQQLVEFDLPTGRPGGLRPTLERIAGPLPKVSLDVDAFYWGVRRVVGILASDPSLEPTAVVVLAPWFDALRTPYRYVDTVSTTPTFSVSSHGMDATLGAVSEVSSIWEKPRSD